MRIGPRLCRAWHHNNAADTIKGAALHIGTMAGLAAAADTGVAHLPTRKRHEAPDH